MAQPPSHSPAGAAENRTLVFRLGKERFGLPLSSVREVLQVSAPPSPVPGAPRWVRGIINHHGQVIPVIRLSELLAVEPDQGSGQTILLDWEGERLAFEVDQILSLDEVRLEGPTTQGKRRAWYRGSLLLQLDPATLAGLIRDQMQDGQAQAFDGALRP